MNFIGVMFRPDSPTGRGGRLKPGLLWVRIPLGVLFYALIFRGKVPVTKQLVPVRGTSEGQEKDRDVEDCANSRSLGSSP